MIQKDELSRLLTVGETDRVECTTSTKDTDNFSEAVTAFANDLPNHRLPGYLVTFYCIKLSSEIIFSSQRLA